MSLGNETVFLVDDDESLLAALARVIETGGFTVRPFTRAADFLKAHDPQLPGCLVTDLAMPDMSGMELLCTLRNHAPPRFVIFVTGKGDIPVTVSAMKAGAVSFLAKPVRREELLGAIREAIEKDASSRESFRRHTEIATRLQSLTPREHQVLELVASGLLNKQIAAQLGTAEKTIKVHRGRLLRKMQVRSAVALAGLLGTLEHQIDAGRE